MSASMPLDRSASRPLGSIFVRHDAPRPTVALPSTAEGSAKVRAATTVVERTPARPCLGPLGQMGCGGRSASQGCQGVRGEHVVSPANPRGPSGQMGAPRVHWAPRVAFGPDGASGPRGRCSRQSVTRWLASWLRTTLAQAEAAKAAQHADRDARYDPPLGPSGRWVRGGRSAVAAQGCQGPRGWQLARFTGPM